MTAFLRSALARDYIFKSGKPEFQSIYYVLVAQSTW